MTDEKSLVTLLTTQPMYQKMEEAGITDENEQEKYFLTKILTGTAKEKVRVGTFREAFNKVLMNYELGELTPHRQEIFNQLSQFLNGDESKTFYDNNSDDSKQYNVLQISCYDDNDDLIHVNGNSRNFALLDDKVSPYIVEIEMDNHEKVDSLDMRVSLRAMNARR